MATSTLTLQTATAANFDSGWTQTVGNTWTSTSLVLTVTGAGSILLELSARDDDSSGRIYDQVVPWSASGTLTIPMPTPFYGQVRLKGTMVAAGGTVAVAISGELSPSVMDSSGNVQFPGTVVAPNINGQTYSSATKITTMPGSVVQSGGLLRLNGMNRVFANFRKALMRSNIGGGNLRIGLVGDSTIAAMGAVNGGTNVAGCRPRSIGKHFSDMMSSTLGLPGNRDSVFGSGVVSNGADYTTYTAYDPRVVLTGAVGFDSVGGTLGAQPFKFTTTGQVLTFTPDNAFTKIRIYSINNQVTFGSVRVSVGGVDKADIVSSGGTGFLTTTITASGSAVVITALETKTFDLIGIETWDDTKPGISVLEMGWSGSFMSSMAGNANAYSHARALASLNLDCVILKCTTNDCIAPTSKAAYLASLQQFISLQPITCDIFFADLFPSSYQDAKPGVLDGYRDAAVEAGLPVLDLREMYGQSSTEAISTGLAIGAVHPGEIAYATIARMYSERLRPWI